MNKKRRMKNRETARQLARDTAPPCPECGQNGPHWVGVPMTLADLMSGTEPEGFWLCDKFYGPDGKRLHSMSKSLEGSGRLDEHENPDAYATVLDAMNFLLRYCGA